jgi:uncharacterized protein (DUF1330 family)
MSAYLLVRVEITNFEKYKLYLAAVPSAIAKYGGKYTVRAGETITLEGPEEKRRIVIIEFPSMEKAKEFYYSEEYTEIRKLRRDAAVGDLMIVEGANPTT